MSRILARALGATAGAAPVRPRLPTRFEPGLGIVPVPGDFPADGHERLHAPESGKQVLSRTGAGYSPTQPVLPPARAASTAATASAGQGATWPAHPAGPARTRVPRPLPPGDSAVGQAAAPLADSALLADPAPLADSALLAGLASFPNLASFADPAPLADLAAFADETPLAGPAQSARRREPPAATQAGPPRQRHRPGQENAEPVVRIEIGRVEIRADRADAPVPRRQAAGPRQPALELSEYLRRRGGQR